jgi:hypothetical protein
MNLISENYKWLFDGIGGLVLIAVAGYFVRRVLRRPQDDQKDAATLNAQGAKVTNSPVASGTNISQTINSPTVNLSLPAPSFGAPGSERYEEWRELIDEIHESIEQMGYAFVPIVAHEVGDERCDYQAGIRCGNRVLRNRILIADVIQKSGLIQDWDELVQYAHSGRGPRDRWKQGSPSMGGFDVKARAFQEKLMRVARDDVGTRGGVAPPLEARESEQDRQASANMPTTDEDQSSWPDVILECQWPSLVHESKIPGSHTVRKRPWMLRHGGPGAVYNVCVRKIDFGEYEARFPFPVRTLTDTASVYPIICWKSDGLVIDAHDLESLIHNPPSGCDVQQYAVGTDGNEGEEIRLEDFVLEVEIPVTISYDDKNGNRFRIKYLLHYDTYMEKGEMIRTGRIEKVAPK